MSTPDINQPLPTEDEETKLLGMVSLYMAKSDQRTKDGFMYYLTYRFYPKGRFNPEEAHIEVADFMIKNGQLS